MRWSTSISALRQFNIDLVMLVYSISQAQSNHIWWTQFSSRELDSHRSGAIFRDSICIKAKIVDRDGNMWESPLALSSTVDWLVCRLGSSPSLPLVYIILVPISVKLTEIPCDFVVRWIPSSRVVADLFCSIFCAEFIQWKGLYQGLFTSHTHTVDLVVYKLIAFCILHNSWSKHSANWNRLMNVPSYDLSPQQENIWIITNVCILRSESENSNHIFPFTTSTLPHTSVTNHKHITRFGWVSNVSHSVQFLDSFIS